MPRFPRITLNFRDKISLSIATLVVFALFSAGLAWRTAATSQAQLEEGMLADANLALYLDVAANMNDLAKQYADALIIGDRDNGAGERELKQRLARDLARLRETTTREIELVGVGEVPEFERIVRIERLIAAVDREFEAVRPLAAEGDGAEAYSRLVTLFDDRIDRVLKGLLREAVEEERQEAEAVRAEAEALLATTRRGAALAALLVLVIGLFAVFGLGRTLNRPLGALIQGVRALRDGNLSHRITVAGSDELAQLSKSFNAMAEQLEAARGQDARHRAQLEVEVERRTGELTVANTRMSEQDRLRRRFLADVSHELRTPLTVIRGEAEVTMRDRRGTLDPAARETLESIVREVDHMGRLVDDLMFVARREAGEARLALRPVALVALVAATVASAKSLAEPSGTTIAFTAHDERLVVEADPHRLRQLLMVLLDNAVRYGGRGGSVRIHVLPAPAGVAIRVEDDGIGIPEDEIDNVFERFVRGSNALPGGSGLGLPVARAIAEAHGGSLALSSRVGEGTVATVTLPLAQPIRRVA